MQEAAGQLQTADNFETMGIMSYQHTFSSDVVADVSGMVRDNANDFYSNADATPIEILQHNWFREGYFKAQRHDSAMGRHEIKAGVGIGQSLSKREFSATTSPITPNSIPSTPLTFSFHWRIARNLEQSVYVEDLDPPRELDDERRAPLGPLSALC